MTDADAFLAAIIADPDNDLPRLVFADWLEEHGDPDRAEFIRLECALAADALPPAERGPAGVRSHELLARHRKEWDVPGVRGVQVFRRGFVEYLRVSTPNFLQYQEQYARAAPITHLRVSTDPARVVEVAAVPWLARLRRLELVGVGVGSRLRDIFQPNRFPELWALKLQNNPLWPDDVGTLAQLGYSWPKLHRLDLSGNPISDAGVLNLASSNLMPRLAELVLRSDDVSELDRIHAEGVSVLANGSSASRLQRLDLSGQRIGDHGLQLLLEARNLPRLEALDVSHNDIGHIPQLWTEVLPAETRLRRLSLARNRIDEDAAMALVAWPALRDGCVVDLRDCDLTDRSEAILMQSAVRSQLLLEPEDSQ